MDLFKLNFMEAIFSSNAGFERKQVRVIDTQGKDIGRQKALVQVNINTRFQNQDVENHKQFKISCKQILINSNKYFSSVALTEHN